MEELDSADLKRLHQRFLQLCEANVEQRDAILEEVLIARASQSRLSSATGTVLGRLASRRDLRAEIMQEASLILLARLRSGHFQYEDRGWDAFGGWLWTSWHMACKEAWRRTRPLWLRPSPISDSRLRQSAGEHDHAIEALEIADSWQRVLSNIDQISDERLRAVMAAWAAAFSGRETARMLALSEPTVCRLRKRGLEALKRILDDER
jgi:DNA-directed RNA polymerase specialized sigma24 family protein